jgi:hypothetical protein
MYNDFDKVLNSFEIGGENKPPKWGPWSPKAKSRRRKKKQERTRKKNCGKPGCSQKGRGLI